MLQSTRAVHGENVDLFRGGRQKALELEFLALLLQFLERFHVDREYRGEYRIRLQWLSDTEVEEEVREIRKRKSSDRG